MSIGIVAVRQTILNIDTSGSTDLLNLEQMENADHPIVLKPGINKIPVGAGIYRVLSNGKISITTDTINTMIVVTFGKDDPGDPPKLPKLFSPEVHAFFTANTELGESAPT